MTNLFLHVLQRGAPSRLQNDLTVMEVGFGFFSYLEITTGFRGVPQFVRILVQLAREFAEKAQTIAPDFQGPVQLADVHGMAGVGRGDLAGSIVSSGSSVSLEGYLPADTAVNVAI